MTPLPTSDSVPDQAANSVPGETRPANGTRVSTTTSSLLTESSAQAQPEVPAENGSASLAGDRASQNPQAASMPNNPFHQGLPPELQSLLAGVLAAVGAPPNAFQNHFAAGQPGMQPGGNPVTPSSSAPSTQQDQGQPPANGPPAPPGTEDPRAFFRQQFAQFAEALRQTSTARADPERAEELLRGLKDPGQTVLRRLVRICEVEDARGETNEGVQCGICLDTITEIFERVSSQETCQRNTEVVGSSSAKEAEEMGTPAGGSIIEPSDTEDKAEMKDVEMLVDGQEAIDDSENTTFKAFPCHHLFCGECLLPWLSTHTTCPTCRLDIDPHSVTLRRPISRQRRTTSIRPTTSRSAGERNPRIAGTPNAWRFLRPSSRAPETPPPGSQSVAANLPPQPQQLYQPDTNNHRVNDTPQPVSDSPRRDHHAPSQISASPQPTTASSNRDSATSVPHTGPMSNIIVFLTGNPPGSPTPPGVGAGESVPVPPSGSTAHEGSAAPRWGDGLDAGGPMFLTIDVIPDPPTNASNPAAPTPPAIDGPTGSQTTAAAGAPGIPPREPMAPPTLFAFPPNFLGMANPFAPPPGEMTYTRSSAIWTPPTPKNSLEQWLLKRERELNIVCDDPHCKYICPDIISNFDDALIHVQAFGSHNQLCEHKHHMTCLVEGNQSTGWYRMINQEAKQAALRCLQCRNHGWIDVPTAQSDT